MSSQSFSCTQVRRMLVKHGTLNIRTGQSTTDADPGTMETRACGVPLFSDAERQRGTCRSCNDGYTHPNNYPVSNA